MFTESRKRTEGREYKQSDEDIKRKVARIEELESKNLDELDTSEADEIVKEIFKPQSGRVWLYGRGVTPTTLQGKGLLRKSSVKVPSKCMESLKLSLENEMKEKLEMEKAAMEQKWQSTVALLFKQLVEANPRLNLGPEMYKTLSQIQSHEKSSTQTQDVGENNIGLSEN